MKTKPIIFFATVLAACAMGGCSRETTSSANIRTAGIAALIDVTATSATLSTVHVDLVVGGSSSNTFVTLEGGDSLTARAGTESKTMQQQDAGEYEAEFSTAAAGTEFFVELDRTVDDDARGSKGTMPAPFEITGVPQNSPSRSGDDITLTWDATETGSKMLIAITGTCIFSENLEVPGETGSTTITKGTLESSSSSMPKDCVVDVEMKRTENGVADAIFDGESWFRLHQVRTAQFTSKI